ncbi:MAG: glycosyltransferase, partial [Acidimicrobiales bacterium]
MAVIVASEPGPWFEEALACFGSQDYPNLSVLVIDGCRSADPTPRVASVLPEAYVRRVDGGGTFATLANDALQTVQGASFLAFCHDDVAPDSDAIRRMVEEAFRSNAAVVAPKVVEWDRPERLLDVGLVVDKTGTTAPVVDKGELDQEQHDAVRDVFAVTNTCMLVRSDLFSALGGFDSTMGDNGVDVDFCWRAQIAGGRVLVAPAARVRHRLGGPEAQPPDADHLKLDRRHHLRAMLKSYSFLHLLRVVPQAFLVTLVELILALVGRRWSEVGQIPSAWWWNLRHPGDLRQLRKATQKARAVPDSDVRRLQVRGSVRLTNYLRRRLHADDRAEAIVAAGHRLAGSVGRGPGQAAAVVLGVLALAVLAGSRNLISGRLPAVGELAPFSSVSTFLGHWVSGWRLTGLGSAAPAPTAFGLLGVSGFLFLGKVAVLQKLLIVGAWPLAALGTWRLTRRFGSSLARLAAVVAYLAIPVSYGALARGRWTGLVAWAAMPWLLTIVARLSGLAPFGADLEESEAPAATRARAEAVKLGLILAVAAAFAPSVAVALAVAVLGLLLGSLLVGGVPGMARALAGSLAALLVALVLHVPWSVDLFTPGGWATVAGVAPDPSRAPALSTLLRFELGPMGAAPLGWAFLVAAVLPLAIGRSWRLAWAVRCWAMSLTCILVAWAGARGWLPVRLETPDVLLAPAALGL